MGAQVDLKGAITKYLKNEWDEAEKEELKKTRYEFASEMVPIALGSSEKPISLGSMEEYIYLLTNDPESDKGQVAISYLSELLRGDMTHDRRKIEKIVDLAKLYYLKKKFFGDAAEIEYGDLKYGGDYVKFTDGIVEIKKRLSREELFDLVSGEKKLYATPFFFHISSAATSDFGNLILSDPSKSEAEIIDSLKETIKSLEMKRVDKALKNLKLEYRVEFDEGKATTEKLVLNKYSDRVDSILGKILAIPQK